MKTHPELLEWKPVSRKTIFSTRIFDIHELTSISPEKNESIFYTMHATDWVIVIPILQNETNDDSFLMVHQWRHGIAKLSIEFPGGVIDPGETPEKAAGRELMEETGYKAGQLTHAATFSPNPAIMDNHCHVFFAEKLENTHQMDLDDDEFVASEAIPVQDIITQMGQGAYIHGLMVAALFVYIQKKGLPVIKDYKGSPTI